MLPLGFASFLAFGVVLVLLGANQDDLRSALDLDLASTGLLASALSVGIGVGVVVAGPWADRWPRKPIYLASMGLAAAPLLAFGPSVTFALAMLLIGLTGLGIGIYDTLISALVGERYLDDSARPMAAVHSGATLAAVLAPPLMGWIAASSHWSLSFRLTGAAHLVLAAVALFVPLPPPPVRAAVEDHLRRERLWPALAPLAVVSFAYVGVETALTIFAVPYAHGLGLDTGRGLSAISALWVGLLAGRLALLPLRGEIDARFLIGAGLLGALVVGAGAATGWTAIELHFGLAGLSVGFVFPLMVTLVGQRFPESRAKAMGLAAGAGAAGGFAVPWLHGALGDAAGIGVAVTALAFWALVVAGSAMLAQRSRPRR